MRTSDPTAETASGSATRRRTALRGGAAAFALFGFGCLVWVGWTIGESTVVEAREGRRLAQAREALTEEAPARAPTLEGSQAAHLGRDAAASDDPGWEELSEGDLVGRIGIERIDVSAIVLAGTSRRTLRRAVGHIPGTALPGEPGNVGLAGHRDSFFRELGDVEPGDHITLETIRGDVTYRVDSTFVVDPSDVHVLDPPENGEIVTLVSCYPFYYVGPAPQRFIVHGHRVESPRRRDPSGDRLQSDLRR